MLCCNQIQPDGLKEKGGSMHINWKRRAAAFTILAAVALAGCARETRWQKQIRTEELVIEGVSGEYDLLFLTDTHMIVMDEEDSQQVADNAAPRYKMFVNKEGVPSAEQFDEWVEYADNKALDGVLLGGDIIDYPSDANIEHLKEQLAGFDMPYLYTLGNHDWTYPWEYMTETGKNTYLPLLEPYMDGNCAIQVQDFGEFLVVAVDNSGNQVSSAALEEYEETLKQGKPVILMVHVPFYNQSVLEKAKTVWKSPVVLGGGSFGGIYPDANSQRFMELTTAADSPVQAVLAGHVHFYDKAYIEGEKKVLQIVGDAGYAGNAILLQISG